MKHFPSFLHCVVVTVAATTVAAQVPSDGSPASAQRDSAPTAGPVPQLPAGRSAPDTPVTNLPAPGQEQPRPPGTPNQITPEQPAVPVQRVPSSPIPLAPLPIGPTSDGLAFTLQQSLSPPPGNTISAPVPVSRSTPSPTGINAPDAANPGAPARPCTSSEPNGTASAPPSPAPSTQFPGVSASQFRRAGVGADQFERPGVSAAQLATLLPGGGRGPCAAPRDFVLYPEPINRPRPVQPAQDEP